MKNANHIKSNRRNIAIKTIENNIPPKKELERAVKAEKYDDLGAPDFGQTQRDWAIADLYQPQVSFVDGWKEPMFDSTTGTSLNLEPNREPWIQTFTGKRFQPLNPTLESICIEDIAHALSMICRFNGHVSQFYSVGQHCVLVSYLCDEKDAMHGLLHDASESYIADFSSPLKNSGQFENYRAVENKLQSMIFKRFGLDDNEPASVKKADKRLLYTEAKDLMSPLHADWVNAVEPLPFKIEPWNQQKAKEMFLKRFDELYVLCRNVLA